jgi:phage shock protein A
MNIYSKLRTLIISKAEQPVRNLVDTNDLIIFEQEIRSAQELVKHSKLHLAVIKSDVALLRQSSQALQQDIYRLEKQTIEAMEKDEKLAIDLANRIAEDEENLKSQNDRIAELTTIEQRVSKDLKRAMHGIKSYKNRLVILKASENREAAHSSSQQRKKSLNVCLLDLDETLQSIQQRQLRDQSMEDAVIEVDSVLSDNNLEERMQAVGISTGKLDGQAVLDRLKKSPLVFT